MRLKLFVAIAAALWAQAASLADGLNCHAPTGKADGIICLDRELREEKEKLMLRVDELLDKINSGGASKLWSSELSFEYNLSVKCVDIIPSGLSSRECIHKELVRRSSSLIDPYKPAIIHENSDYSCPLDDPLRSIGISWTDVEPPQSDSGFKEHRAIIDLPEWGGKRPVFLIDWSTNREAGEWLEIGKIDGVVARNDNDNWFNNTSKYGGFWLTPYKIIATDKGIYIVASSDDLPEPERVYFRVGNNEPIPVCSISAPILDERWNFPVDWN